MPKFIRKDAHVEASQFTEKQAADKRLWPEGAAMASQHKDGHVVTGVGIPGCPDGVLVLQPGDWIIRTSAGKDKPDVVSLLSDIEFKARYDAK